MVLDGQLSVPLNTLMESLVGAELMGLWQCQPIFHNIRTRSPANRLAMLMPGEAEAILRLP
jgi:hypothetical protein